MSKNIMWILTVGFVLGFISYEQLSNFSITTGNASFWEIIATLANVFLVIGTGTGLHFAFRELKLLEIEKIHKYRDQYIKIRNEWIVEDRIEKASAENIGTISTKQELLLIDLLNLSERVCYLVDKKLLDEEIVFTSFERVVIQDMENEDTTKKIYDAHPKAFKSTRKIYKRWKDREEKNKNID